MDRQHTTRALFGAERALIGCVHVAALPGTAAYSEADAFIVGTALKRDGLWTNPVDPARATALRRAFDAPKAR